MLNLIGQIITLALTVGGIYLSALALANPIRKVAIVGLSALGLANLVLVIVTYEKTPDVPHIADAIDWIRPRLVAAWEMLAWAVWRPSVGMLTTFIVGLILGPLSIWLYFRSKKRDWHSSFGIFKFVDPELIAAADAEIQILADQIMDLQKERSEFGRQPDGSININSAALEILSASMRETHAKQHAAYELREKALRNATGGIYEKLKDGELIAKGFKDPLGLNPKENEIPAAYRKFLKFSGDYKEAAGKGIKYTAIEIARK